MRVVLLALMTLLWGWSSGTEVSPTRASSQGATFSKDVAPIFYAKCVYCHRPGEIAPMSLLTYEASRPWARSIRQEVLRREMPPWRADPMHGDFRNDRRLTDDEIRTIVAWVDSGAPEGNPADLPAGPRFSEGWQIGEPDLVVEMPSEITIPATGVIEYQLVESDYVFPEDVWVQAIEVRPGNRAVTHHAVATGVPDGDPQGEVSQNAVGLHLYAPGLEAIVWRDGYGKFIPKGTRIHFNLHYNAIGRETTDRTKVGFVFARQPVHTEVHTQLVMNRATVIPAMVDDHEVTAAFRFPSNARIQALRPHMHLRGKSAAASVVYPAGDRKVLLHIPEWDDGWQNYYILSEPVRVPEGALLEYVAVYDNSPKNPYNPDPKADVPWGQQVWDEMMVVYMTWTEENPQNINDHQPIQVPIDQLFTTGVAGSPASQ